MIEPHMMTGQLISGVGSLYVAENAYGEKFSLRCKRKFRHMHISPLVGDMIMFSPGTADEDGWIEEILPRKNQCIRPPVANIDVLVIVVAPVPEPDLLLVDRLMIQAEQQCIERILVVSKCDISPLTAEMIEKEYSGADIEIAAVSSQTGQGVEQLRKKLAGKVCCLAGQSGVGKSTLINCLIDTQLETGEISKKIQRGKNTTRSTTLIRKNGISVFDTAGFSLLETENVVNPETLKDAYPEFLLYEGKCKFSGCIHCAGKGCAVLEAVSEGKISQGRYQRYIKLLDEAKEKWRQRYD